MNTERWGFKLLHRVIFEKETDVVTPEIRKRAARMVDFVRVDLKLPSSPEIVWIESISPESAKELIADWKGNRILRAGDKCHLVRWAGIEIRPRNGFTPGEEASNEIWLHITLSATYEFEYELEYVAAHETRHHWQKKERRDVFDDECAAEGDAHPYAFAILKRYLAEHGHLSKKLEEEMNNMRDSWREKIFLCCPNGRFEIIPY